MKTKNILVTGDLGKTIDFKTMSKTTIQLLGGIGNNLFQIASAYSYSLKHDKELILLNNKHGATHGTLSSYSDNILNKIKFQESHNFSNFKTYSEPFFHYAEIPECKESVLLNGYYQSELHFKEYEKEIKELFSYPKEYEDSIKEKYKHLLSQNTCSIHVRRGDYLNSPSHHPVQSVNYYMRAIKKMPKNSIFLIFSDDKDGWCKHSFPDLPEKFIFINGNEDYEDLLLMSLCKSNIIANSSFSWWAAWLNNNSDKIVVAPEKWFGTAYNNCNTDDLYCDGWIKI